MPARCVCAILLFTWFVCFATACVNDDVAIYEVNLKMMWSEDKLPKDSSYIDKPQWSPVFGQSHNRSYVLYHVGDTARPAVQNLVKNGIIDELMLQGEEEPKVYDQFSAPAVGSGEGETKGLVVVDGEHSLVSFITRMTPTPDWFVGVDSLDLCIDSSWVDQITLDLEPLSVGSSKKGFSDNDYTTSSDPVSKVGHKTYNHMPRFYKTSREIPTIAKAEFTKKEIYSSEEINKLVRDDILAKLKQKDQYKTSPVRKLEYTEQEEYQQTNFPKRRVPYTDNSEPLSEVTTKSYEEHLKELEEEPFGTPAPYQPENNVIVVTKAPNFVSSEEDDEVNDEWMSMDDAVLAVANGRKLGLNEHLPRHFKSRLHHAVNRPRRNYDVTF